MFVDRALVLRRDAARQRVAVAKSESGCRAGADHLRDGDRLADRAAEPEDDGRGDPRRA